eukprot:COSAG02_NODE_42249_length_386_cov_0.724739_2_plen_79_part_01
MLCRSVGPKCTSMWDVPELLDQVCQEDILFTFIVAHPDLHEVCTVCDVPLDPKLRYRYRYSSEPSSIAEDEGRGFGEC